MLVFAVTLPCTVASLVVATEFGFTSVLAQVVAILAGSAIAALARFLISRAWSFRDHTRANGGLSDAR